MDGNSGIGDRVALDATRDVNTTYFCRHILTRSFLRFCSSEFRFGKKTLCGKFCGHFSQRRRTNTILVWATQVRVVVKQSFRTSCPLSLSFQVLLGWILFCFSGWEKHKFYSGFILPGRNLSQALSATKPWHVLKYFSLFTPFAKTARSFVGPFSIAVGYFRGLLHV